MTTAKHPVGRGAFERAMVLLIVSVFSHTAMAQIPDAVQQFDTGTRFLADGRFSDAITAFNRAEELGVGSGPLFYNRGLAYYRMDSIGEAIRDFQKAARLLPDDPKVKHSLSIANLRVVDHFSELPIPVWKRAQRSIDRVFSVTAMFLIGITGYLLLIALIMLSRMGLASGEWNRRARLAAGLTAFLFLVAGFSSSIWPPYPQESVIVSDSGGLFEQPDSSASVSQMLHEGLVVVVLSSDAGWTLVRLPNGLTGWMESAKLGSI